MQLPCTTPASQQAILMGRRTAYRRSAGTTGARPCPRREPPQDAAIIEARASTGHGLLADDGVSISNLFTGDAPKAAMTMSRLE